MSARWSASALALLLFLDALAVAIGTGAALRYDVGHHLGGGGDGGAGGAVFAILIFATMLLSAGLLVALLVAALRTPKAGPIAWRSTLMGVLIGFNFGLPVAILSGDKILLAVMAFPSLLLLIACFLPLPRRPLLLAMAPLVGCALVWSGIALAGAVGDAQESSARDERNRIRAAIAGDSASDVSALMSRLHWKGVAGDVDFECEALARQRPDTLAMLLARAPQSQERSPRLMRAIVTGDGPALRAQLAQFNALDVMASGALTPVCLGDLMALSICDARLETPWSTVFTLPEKELGVLLLGLAGKKQICAEAIENFLRRDQLMLPSGKIDPRLYAPAIGDFTRALELDEPSYDDKSDTVFGAQLARWIAAPELMRPAIERNNQRLVTWTARHLASIDAPDACGTTPLAAAIADGRESVVSWLLAHGADANRAAPASCNSPSLAPLILALLTPSTSATLEMVPALLAHGADARAKGPTGESAAALAKKSGDDYLARKIEQSIRGDMMPAPR